jgi:hypothetical protein
LQALLLDHHPQHHQSQLLQQRLMQLHNPSHYLQSPQHPSAAAAAALLPHQLLLHRLLQVWQQVGLPSSLLAPMADVS